jgi:tetratricopeptide (TPR) repeat protein
MGRSLIAMAWLAVACGLLSLGGCLVRTDKKIYYGLSHYEAGLYGHAIRPLREAAARLDSEDPTDPRLPRVLEALGRMATSTGRPDLAEQFFARGVEKSGRLDPPDDRVLQRSLVTLGLFYRAQRRAAEAISPLERACEIASAWEDDRLGYAIALDNLSLAHSDLERWEEARRGSDEALAVLDALGESPDNDRTRAVVLFNRAASVEVQGNLEEVEALYVQAIEIFERNEIPREERWRLGVMLDKYSKLLETQGRTDEAATATERARAQR